MGLPVDLQPGEQIVKEYKRHPIFLIKQLLLVAAAGIIPILILDWLAGILDFLAGIATPLSIIWAIAALGAAFVAWYSYQHDQWIVTNSRIIDLNKRNPFNTKVSMADLVNVLDITIQQRGVLASIFHYGDVECQTAGGSDMFVMKGVADPKAAMALLDQARDQARLDMKHS